MVKKRNKGIILILVIGIVLLGLFLFRTQIFGEAENFIDFNLYDENGNPISVTTLSIVEGVPGVSFIDLTITLTNTGTEPLSCSLISVSPTAFSSAIDKSSKLLPKEGKVAWTSSLIDVSQFESETSTEFTATIRCIYTIGTETFELPDKSGTLSLFIQPEVGEVGFDVSVDLGGIGTEFCGDNVCQIDEIAESCPADCGVSALVMFRTTDLSYPSGSAIAFSTICGNNLIAYGYETKASSSGTSCASHSSFGALIMENLPVSDTFNTHSGGSSGNLQLFQDSLDINEVWICELDADGSGMIVARYDKRDSDISKVDTSSISFDLAKEVPC